MDRAGQVTGLPFVVLAHVDEERGRLRLALEVDLEGRDLADLGARLAQDVGIGLGHGIGGAPMNDGLARAAPGRVRFGVGAER